MISSPRRRRPAECARDERTDTESGQPGAVHQPRAVAARIQPARARTWPRTTTCRCSSGCVSCASAARTSTSSSRSASPGLIQQQAFGVSAAPGPDNMSPADSCARISAGRARAARRAVPRAERVAAAASSTPKASASCRAIGGTSTAVAGCGTTSRTTCVPILTPGRPRPGAPVPEGAEQEPQLHRARSKARTRSAARAAKRSCRCRARCRDWSACRRRSRRRRTISCSCRRSSTRTSAICSPA